MIFEETEHEALTARPFVASEARAFVREVVRAADDAFKTLLGWPTHPEDRSADENAEFAGIYCGSAGTMLALTTLARSYDIDLRHDYREAIVECEEMATIFSTPSLRGGLRNGL